MYGNYSYTGYQSPYQSPYQTPYLPPTQMSAPQPTQNDGLRWVQGISGAKSYMVSPGTSVLLMDSEADRFYIKSADPAGMPLPLRIFNYTEIKENNAQSMCANNAQADYITREEFEKRISELKGSNADEQLIQRTSTSAE